MTAEPSPTPNVIRPMGELDEAFVVMSWLRSFGDSDMALNATPHDDAHVERCGHCGAFRVQSTAEHVRCGDNYWLGQRKLILRLMARSLTQVSEAPDGLLDGFACIEWTEPVPIAHYTYVRRSARRKGVARALLAPLLSLPRVLYSHRSRLLDARKLPKAWKYDPYAVHEGP